MVSNIWVAASDNQISLVEEYLNSGKFTPNSKDPNGYTPIHAAASYGHIDLLRKLIERGGDINIQDEEGDTPLHHVEDINMAKILVEEFKADWKIKNAENQTAAQYIEEDGEFPELAAYLLSLSHNPPTDSDHKDSLPDLPPAGNFEGHDIRYTLEDVLNDDDGFDREARRKEIESIINSENPEEGLRDLVKNIVHEGMEKHRQETAQAADESSLTQKKRKGNN